MKDVLREGYWSLFTSVIARFCKDYCYCLFLFTSDVKFVDEIMSEKTENTEIQCAVCLSNFSRKCITPCNHEFCKDCIIQSIQYSFRNRNRTACPLCRTDINIHSIKINGVPLIERQAKTIFGSVYVQGFTLGLASYHFDSEGDCYISYCSPKCSIWPPLDDGSRPPAKKLFENMSFDLERRTFEGDIIWAPNSWRGDKRWKYQMEFSENFDTICGGFVQRYDELDSTEPESCSTYGESLLYDRYYEELHKILQAVESESDNND